VLGPSDDEDAADLLLRHFNMEVYYPAFQIAGYTRMEQLVHLSAQDLDAIEQRSHIPILPAHRRLLLSAERAAWAQVSLVAAPSAVVLPSLSAPAAPASACPICRHLLANPLHRPHEF
jgi:hypothetical protein